LPFVWTTTISPARIQIWARSFSNFRATGKLDVDGVENVGIAGGKPVERGTRRTRKRPLFFSTSLYLGRALGTHLQSNQSIWGFMLSRICFPTSPIESIHPAGVHALKRFRSLVAPPFAALLFVFFHDVASPVDPSPSSLPPAARVSFIPTAGHFQRKKRVLFVSDIIGHPDDITNQSYETAV